MGENRDTLAPIPNERMAKQTSLAEAAIIRGGGGGPGGFHPSWEPDWAVNRNDKRVRGFYDLKS